MKDRPEGCCGPIGWGQQERLRSKIVLIDAVKDASWTAARAHRGSPPFFGPPLLCYGAGERIAFRLPNGPESVRAFSGLAAGRPCGGAAGRWDAGGGLPETARRLGARRRFISTANFNRWERLPREIKNVAASRSPSGQRRAPKAVECRAEHLLADGRQVIRTMGIRAHDLNLAAIRWATPTAWAISSCR